MKIVYILLTIFLLIGTAIPQKKKPMSDFVIQVKDTNVKKMTTDSAKKDYFKAVEESNKQNDLLILEKKKADKQNVFLRKENARLKKALNIIDTVYIKKINFFKRFRNLFKKKSKL